MQFVVGGTVVVEGELREFMTITCASRELMESGFPYIGLTPTRNVSVIVSTSERSIIDYRSPVAESGVLWHTKLGPEAMQELELYEEAVLELCVLDMNDCDMDTSI